MSDKVLFQTDDDLDQANLGEATEQTNSSDYVEEGLGFTPDHTNDTLTIASGYAVVVDATAGRAYHAFPDQKTGLSLTAAATNHVFISIDPSTDNSISYHIDTDNSAPTDPSLKIGEVDTANDTHRDDINRAPAITARTYNGRIQVSPSDDIQGRLDDAGVDGYVEFEPGDYHVDQLSPSDGQTWSTGESARFLPTADNPAIDFSGVEDVVVNALEVDDSNSNTTSAAAVQFDNNRGIVIGYLNVHNSFHGVSFEETNGDIRECHIGCIRVQAHRRDGMRVQGDVHDNYFGDVQLYGNDAAGTGLFWSTSGIDGGNVFSRVVSLHHDTEAVELAGGELELWVDTMILEADGNGLKISANSIHRLFIDKLWASSCGVTGVLIEPGAGNTLSEIIINQSYTWNNTDFGWLINTGTTEGLYVGSLVSQGNNQGATGKKNLRVAGTLNNSYIGWLRSYGGPGVDVTGSTTKSHIMREAVDDGIDFAGFTTVNGMGQEAAGADSAPTASNYQQGHIVENTDDNIIWIKDSSDTMRPIGGPQSSAYSTSNVTTDRTYDADSTTTAEVADVLGTLIADLQSAGILE